MASTERVTVTLPNGTLDAIDRYEANRSRFITEAVAREIERRQREEFLLSLANPHPESVAFAQEPLGDWVVGEEDTSGLVDPAGGTKVRWVPGQGWVTEC